MIQTSRNQFWYLSALGVWGLWGYAVYNGMFRRLDEVMRTNLLPDGRPLRETYSGFSVVDDQLRLVTIFYEMLSNGLSSGPRLLFFDINYIVACTNLWVLIESRRTGHKSWFIRYPFWAMILWNLNGAAIMLPPYLYLLTRSRARKRDATIEPRAAKALFLTTCPILLTPLLPFIPAWRGLSTWEHHGYIAMFHCSPIAITAFYLVLYAILPEKKGNKTSLRNESKKWIVAALILAGLVASAVHLYVVTSALVTKDPDATLIRLFLPTRGTADPITSLPAASSWMPAEYAALLENVHLFSQWDWIVVSLTCLLFSHLLLAKRDGEAKAKTAHSRSESRELAYLAVFTVLLGPGAAGSFALAIGESRL